MSMIELNDIDISILLKFGR